jgi:hypothetical protein
MVIEEDNNDNHHQDGKEPEEEQEQPEEVLLSPRSMAVAAVQDVMQEKQQQQQQQQLLQNKQDKVANHNENSSKTKRSRKHNDDDLHFQLEEIWNGNSKESGDDSTKAQAVQDTFPLIGDVMNELMLNGLEAFYAWGQTKKQVETLKEECDSKDRELARLRTSEQKSRGSITVSQVYCYLEMRMETLVYSIVRLIRTLSLLVVN